VFQAAEAVCSKRGDIWYDIWFMRMTQGYFEMYRNPSDQPEPSVIRYHLHFPIALNMHRMMNMISSIYFLNAHHNIYTYTISELRVTKLLK